MELGINAQKIIAQMQNYDRQLQEAIEKGVTLACEELTIDDNFIQMVKLKAKEEIISTISRAVFQYTTGDFLRKAFITKLEEKIQAYSDQLAEQMMQNLK